MNDVSAETSGDILFTQRCWLGYVTLNRPRALNTLTEDMCLRLDAQMADWATRSEISSVAITGAGGRAFCAGGDVRTIAEAGRNGALTRSFFWNEYRMNRRLFRYPKPYIALADGITMGGGVGISAPAKIRVVTEKTMFAMPETGIGLFPDVGGSYFLSRCPGQTGVYLALTGSRIHAADLLYTGLYTHYLPADDLEEFTILIENEAADSVLRRMTQTPPSEAMLKAHRDVIDRCFSGNSIEDIRDALAADGSEWAQQTLRRLDRMSPLSLRITLRQIREGAKLDFEKCLQMEYRLVRRFMRGHDFFEGVRALLVDKDNAPRWQPATLKDATNEMVDAYFAPLTDEDELRFD
jgi:enoyl-CoA hydratase